MKFEGVDFERRAVEWIVYFLIIFCPLAVGGVTWWALAIFEFGVVLALVLALKYRHFYLWKFSYTVILGALFLLFICLQLIPLPPQLISLLIPNADEWYRVVFKGKEVGGDYAWMPVSFAPIHTLIESAKTAAYLGFFLLALNLFRKKRGDHKPLIAVAVAGFIGFWIGLFQTLLEADSILGFYEMQYKKPFLFMSTFVNANHQGTFYGAAGLVALGFALSRKYTGSIKTLFFIISVSSFIGLWLTLSRGAISLFFPSLVLFWFLHSHKDKTPAPKNAIIFGVLLALTLFGAFYLALAEIIEEMLTVLPWYPKADYSKVTLVASSLSIVGDFPLFGVGRGAFPLVYPHYSDSAFYGRIPASVESIPAQIILDMGIPFGAFLLASIFYVIGRNIYQKLSDLNSIDVGVISAFFFLVLHNLLDFGLELPGIMAIALVLWAHIERERRRDNKSQEFIKPGAKRLWLGGLAALIAILGFLSSFYKDKTLFDCQQRLHRLAISPNTHHDEFSEAFEEAKYHYPTDYFIYNSAAIYALNHPSDKAMFNSVLRNINISFYNAPNIWYTRILSGNYFLAIKKISQALVEYEVALKSTDNIHLKYKIFSYLLKNTKNPSLLFELAGDDDENKNTAFKLLVNSRYEDKRYLDASEYYWLETPLKKREGDIEFLKRGIEIYFYKSEFEKSKRLVDLLMKMEPEDEFSWLYLARIARNKGEIKSAIKYTKHLTQSLKISPYISVEAAGLFAEVGDANSITYLIMRFQEQTDILHHLYYWRGVAYQKRGEKNQAIADFNLAKTIDKKFLKPYFSLAYIWESTEHWELAVWEYQKILDIDPKNTAATERLKFIEEKIRQEKENRLRKMILNK
ncbi:MAG: hypothetical protein Kow0090_16750 [Myxococcota bacterium]